MPIHPKSAAEQVLRAALAGQTYDARLLHSFPYVIFGMTKQDYLLLLKQTIEDIWIDFRAHQKTVREELCGKNFHNAKFTIMVARNRAMFAPVPPSSEEDLELQISIARKDAEQNKRAVLIQLYTHLLGEYVLIHPSGQRNLISSILIPPSKLAIEAARILKIPTESIRLFQTNALAVATAITGQLHNFLREDEGEG